MNPVGNRDSRNTDFYIFGKPIDVFMIEIFSLFSDLDRAMWNELLFPVLSDLEENNEISY